MKNNKNLIALVVAGVIALPAMAQEQVSVVDTAKVKRDAQMHSELSTEVSLLQLQLKRATLQQQIAESQAAVKALNESNAESEEIKKVKELYEEEIAAKDEALKKLQNENVKLTSQKVVEKQKAEAVDPIDTVFVTSVRGIGNNLTAQFYVNNDIVYRRKGDVVVDGIFVENVTTNGALIRTETKSKFLPVTTIEQAHFKVKKEPAMKAEKTGRNDR